MSMLRVYLYGITQKVFIPTMAVTEEGFIAEQGPLHVFQVTEVARWKNKINQMLKDGNPIIPTPETVETPGSVILEHLNIQKWRDFETNAVMYTVHKGHMFITIYKTGRGPDRMWTNEGDERQFASKAPLEVVIDELADDIVKQPEALAKPTTLLLGG